MFIKLPLTADAVRHSQTRDAEPWLIPAFSLALACGALFTLLNIHLPIARNALLYAKAALGILDRNFNLADVVRDAAWTSGKPILFPLLAAPFVAISNANTGTIAASATGTMFFLWASVLTLRRLNRRAGSSPRAVTLAFVFVAANPLVIYQFWSAYPDSLFAGFVLLAFVLTDIIATEPARDVRWHIVALGCTIFAALHTKLYGAILIPSCSLYVLAHARSQLAHGTLLIPKAFAFAGVMGVLAAVLIAVKLGLYPLLLLEATSGAGNFAISNLPDAVRAAGMSLLQLALTVLLAFHVALLFLRSRLAWHAWALAPVAFFGIYVAGLLPFLGTAYNPRYFLPALPLLAFPLGVGALSLSRTARRATLTAFGVVAAALVLAFNFAPLDAKARAVFAGIYDPWLDNLRLPVQIDMRKQIDSANAGVPDGQVLYWVSGYYGTATYGLAEHLGIKKGLALRHVRYAAEAPPSEVPLFALDFGSLEADAKLEQPPDWSVVTGLGHGVFRLDPFWLECAAGPCDILASESSIHVRLRANADTLRIGSVAFLDGGRIIGTDTAPPFELDWPNPPTGRHEIVARAFDVRHGEVRSASLPVYIGMPAMERRVRTLSDVAVEYPDGRVRPSPQPFAAPVGSTLGFRFVDLRIPAGSRVLRSHLEFPAVRNLPQALSLRAELAGSATPLLPERANLSARARSVTEVRWTEGEQQLANGRVRSPDISALLNEVIDVRSWRSGNSLVILATIASPPRSPVVVDKDSSQSPVLYIELNPQ